MILNFWKLYREYVNSALGLHSVLAAWGESSFESSTSMNRVNSLCMFLLCAGIAKTQGPPIDMTVCQGGEARVTLTVPRASASCLTVFKSGGGGQQVCHSCGKGQPECSRNFWLIVSGDNVTLVIRNFTSSVQGQYHIEHGSSSIALNLKEQTDCPRKTSTAPGELKDTVAAAPTAPGWAVVLVPFVILMQVGWL
nr:PREDICTED: uncharacterized protein LOC107077079 [Lepisosteus oculatus]